MSKTEESLAASLSASDTRLIPFLPYLLQDLYELGSDPRTITALLHEHARLDRFSTVIDLGCGKGAVSHEIARTFGCHVEGRDLMEAFIAEARERAAVSGLSDLCNFKLEDVRDSVAVARDFDVAVFGAVGDIFGSPEIMLSSLSKVVRPGGFIVIDDAYSEDPGEYTTLGMWQRYFESAGCEVVAQVKTNLEELVRINEMNQRHIERRAAQLGELHVDLDPLFSSYVADQQAECDALASTLFGVTWLLRKR